MCSHQPGLFHPVGPTRFKVPIEVTLLACQLKLTCEVVKRSQSPTGWHPRFGSARRGPLLSDHGRKKIGFLPKHVSDVS